MSITKKTLKLSLLERVELLGKFPREGGIKKMVVFEDLVKKIRFSQQEIKDFEIKDVINGETTSISWNIKGGKSNANFNVTDVEIEEILKLFDLLDASEKFPTTLLNVYSQLQKLK